MILTLLSFLFIKVAFSNTSVLQPEAIILKSIFKDYDCRARPIYNISKPISVAYEIHLMEIQNVDARNQQIR